MKKSFKILTIVLVLIVIGIIALCIKYTLSLRFKNPKTITINKDNTKVSLTYDDDGKYNINKIDKSEIILKNSSKKFRIDFMYGYQSIKKQKKAMKYAEKDNRLLVIEDVEFHGYKGYASINRKYGTVDIYLYLDEKSDVYVNIRIDTTDTKEILKELKKRDPDKVLYKKSYIQKILRTIKYKK
ncbi:MAG: hypothetical protein IJF92_05860 [Bacilli bacterium]|nr:hypothetical protein [Bacilli bacterium]